MIEVNALRRHNKVMMAKNTKVIVLILILLILVTVTTSNPTTVQYDEDICSPAITLSEFTLNIKENLGDGTLEALPQYCFTHTQCQENCTVADDKTLNCTDANHYHGCYIDKNDDFLIESCCAGSVSLSTGSKLCGLRPIGKQLINPHRCIREDMCNCVLKTAVIVPPPTVPTALIIMPALPTSAATLYDGAIAGIVIFIIVIILVIIIIAIVRWKKEEIIRCNCWNTNTCRGGDAHRCCARVLRVTIPPKDEDPVRDGHPPAIEMNNLSPIQIGGPSQSNGTVAASSNGGQPEGAETTTTAPNGDQNDADGTAATAINGGLPEGAETTTPAPNDDLSHADGTVATAINGGLPEGAETTTTAPNGDLSHADGTAATATNGGPPQAAGTTTTPHNGSPPHADGTAITSTNGGPHQGTGTPTTLPNSGPSQSNGTVAASSNGGVNGNPSTNKPNASDDELIVDVSGNARYSAHGAPSVDIGGDRSVPGDQGEVPNPALNPGQTSSAAGGQTPLQTSQNTEPVLENDGEAPTLDVNPHLTPSLSNPGSPITGPPSDDILFAGATAAAAPTAPFSSLDVDPARAEDLIKAEKEIEKDLQWLEARQTGTEHTGPLLTDPAPNDPAPNDAQDSGSNTGPLLTDPAPNDPAPNDGQDSGSNREADEDETHPLL